MQKKAAEALILSQTRSGLQQSKWLYGAVCACVLGLSIGLMMHWPSIMETQNVIIWPIKMSSADMNDDIYEGTASHQKNPASQDIRGMQLHQISPGLMPAVAHTHMNTPKDALTAQDAAMMYAKFEQMRQGTCQYLEVLQIPDKHKAIYIENVVGGKLPTNLQDLAIANDYLAKVRCNYTPMLMANSK